MGTKTNSKGNQIRILNKTENINKLLNKKKFILDLSRSLKHKLIYFSVNNPLNGHLCFLFNKIDKS